MFRCAILVTALFACVNGQAHNYHLKPASKTVHYITKPVHKPTIKIVDDSKMQDVVVVITEDEDKKYDGKKEQEGVAVVTIVQEDKKQDPKKKEEVAPEPVQEKKDNKKKNRKGKGKANKGDKEKEEECSSVAAAALATPELSTLVAALQAANLVDTLSDTALVATVLAPTNEAFEKLFETFDASAEQVLADPQLTNILLYHVIGGAAALSTDLSADMELTTLLGQTLEVDLSDGVSFVGKGSEASVVAADVAACEAVIHVIDNVLLPDFDALITEAAVVQEPTPVDEPPVTGITVTLTP
eukprot:TRINITY_DN301_c0_g1_i7.p1 TRINITY_DN301_c0_g1~~TRINITY_DN301_c0_g1_i7.p1  ORF type:complete len:300 (+),score=96.62 TRINITY_DN301_c0_g1_i7:79-978(+)